MDGKDKDKIVLATKPVASRPSNTRLLSVILNNTFNGTPSTSIAEATTATRPKTPRLKPSPLFSSSRAVPSRDDASEPVVIYKPKSKLVSRTTAAQLANMSGKFKPQIISRYENSLSVSNIIN